MHRHRVRPVISLVVFVIVTMSWSSVVIPTAFAQGSAQPRIGVETFYPHHAIAGRTTTISVAVPSPDAVTAAEISPATAIAVAAVTGSGSGSEQNIGWWDIALDVAKDAMPGDRNLVLVLRSGRTVPITLSISTHAPAISNLTVVRSTSTPRSVELEMTATDTAGDLGQSPYVWYTAACGGDPIVGAVRSAVTTGTVRAAVPNPRTADGGGATADRCDLRVRLTDARGIDSNTLQTAMELGH